MKVTNRKAFGEDVDVDIPRLLTQCTVRLSNSSPMTVNARLQLQTSGGYPAAKYLEVTGECRSATLD
eukprot:3936708-Rhodomonas_salina.3